MSFDVGDWVAVTVPRLGPLASEVWGEGRVEAVADAPLGGKMLSVRRTDSILSDFHENFCTIVPHSDEIETVVDRRLDAHFAAAISAIGLLEASVSKMAEAERDLEAALELLASHHQHLARQKVRRQWTTLIGVRTSLDRLMSDLRKVALQPPNAS